MPIPRLEPAVIAAIQMAPPGETPEAVAARLGCSVPSVKRYRRAARAIREEAVREAVAESAAVNVPDALADLAELRTLAKAKYADPEAPSGHGQVWLAAIKVTLEHVRPDDAALDAEIELELADLADTRQGTPARPLTVAAGGLGRSA